MNNKVIEDLIQENESLRSRLTEAADTLDAIRTGQIDALVVNSQNGHSLYTLKSADHAYRVFIEQMAEGAVSLNSDGLIIFSNFQFARMVKTQLSSVVGRRFSDFVFADDASSFDQLLAAAREGNVKRDIALISSNNHVDVQLSLNAIELDDNPYVSVIVTDLTAKKEIERQLTSKNEELKRLNEALTRSNYDLQQFASVASHDLQEPLRKIQVFSKFLKDRSYSELSEPSKQYVEKIINCSDRMKMLIVDILSYSQLPPVETSIEEVDLTAILKEILDDFDLRITERNASVELKELCTVEGSKGQLRQLFQNLVSNALKFVSPGRQPTLTIQRHDFKAADLGISLENESAYCRITVVDNGIGFDERYSSSIFGLFEKLNPKTTYEGSGIGLAIAKKIVDKHHGLIIAKSRMGLGSEFNVILPFKQPN